MSATLACIGGEEIYSQVAQGKIAAESLVISASPKDAPFEARYERSAQNNQAHIDAEQMQVTISTQCHLHIRSAKAHVLTASVALHLLGRKI